MDKEKRKYKHAPVWAQVSDDLCYDWLRKNMNTESEKNHENKQWTKIKAMLKEFTPLSTHAANASLNTLNHSQGPGLQA